MPKSVDVGRREIVCINIFLSCVTKTLELVSNLAQAERVSYDMYVQLCLVVFSGKQARTQIHSMMFAQRMALAETDPKVDGCNTEGWLQNSDKQI